MERRLAAVLVAVMVGFSRLMENNESDIINRQKNHRRELIDLEIERHRGSIIKTTGDGLLAEFGSVQDAVRSAIEIQNGMLHRERNFADNEKIEYRFGINVGDVTEDSGDIFGDSVNIAARLEALSVPGGLCVSDIAYQIIQDKIIAGENSAPGVISLITSCEDDKIKEKIGLNKGSNVMLIGCEGDTDQAMYQKLINQ